MWKTSLYTKVFNHFSRHTPFVAVYCVDNVPSSWLELGVGVITPMPVYSPCTNLDVVEKKTPLFDTCSMIAHAVHNTPEIYVVSTKVYPIQ